MDEVKNLVKKAEFSDVAAATSFIYSSWETNKVIKEELVRNLCLAMVAVFIMTLILLANFVAAFFVLICVTLTLVNVMALMTWWGLTIDIITCINLVLSIGLCVDYSAHIALHFMQVKGSRDERARCALKEMGPPVINGAFSTFLSFVLLANSDSHVFLSFFKLGEEELLCERRQAHFCLHLAEDLNSGSLSCEPSVQTTTPPGRIFLGVFIYGVFHGLAFLPVLLSVLGPAPYLKPHHLPGGAQDEGQDGSHRAWMKPQPLKQRESS